MSFTLRPSRAYRCKQCDGEVSFSLSFCPFLRKSTLKGQCVNNHPFSLEWNPGEVPATLPFVDSLEMKPGRPS